MKIQWMWTLFVGVLFINLWSSVQAARRVDVKKRLAASLEQWHSKRSDGDSYPQPSYLLGLGQGEELQESESLKTSSGNTKTKLKETYYGIEIEGESIVIEQDPDGGYTGQVSGHLVEDIEEDLPTPTPRLSAEDAFNVAVNLELKPFRHQFVSFRQDTDAKLMVHLEQRGNLDEVKPSLVWRLSFRVKDSDMVTVSRPFYLIDANSGSIVDNWEGLDSLLTRFYSRVKSSSLKEPGPRHGLGLRKRIESNKLTDINKRDIIGIGGVGGNIRIGKYFYGQNRSLLEVTKIRDACFMHNDHVTVLDNRDFINPWDDVQGHQFDCEEGNKDEINGGYSPINDVYYHCNVVYKLFREWHNTDPLVDMKVVARVHIKMANAFWDGQQLQIGDGSTIYYPMTSADLVAHELGHGFTEHHSGLIYTGESGAMNEAYSDMVGEAAEYLIRENDWHIGQDISKLGKPLRFMDDPSRDNMSISNYDDYCPDMDVHHSSGIFNYAFYLISNQPGWDIKKAFNIFTRANMLYWTPVSSFVDAACGVLEATRDLGYDEDQVSDSFRNAGIEPCTQKPNGLRAMYNLHGQKGQNITFLWTVSDDVKDSHIFISKRNSKEDPDIDLHVESSSYSLSSITKDSGGEQIHIASPSPGPHHIVVQGHDDFNKYVLMVMSNNYTVGSDLSHNEEEEGEIFQLPIEITEDQLQHAGHTNIAIRLHVKDVRNPAPTEMILRFGKKVNFEENLYDYKFNAKSVFHFGKQQIAHIIPCKAQAGTWYLALPGSFDRINVSIYLLHTPRRLKEPKKL